MRTGRDSSVWFAPLGPNLPNLTALALMDMAGRVQCGTASGRATGPNYADRPYFRDAIASPRLVVGEYTIGRVSGRPVLPIALSVRDRSGQVTGVLVAAIDLAWLGDRCGSGGCRRTAR